MGTPALAREYEGSMIGHNVLLRLTDGAAGSAAFGRRLDRLQDRAATDDTGREFGVLQALFPTTDDDPAVRAARHTLVTGLIVFLLIAAAGGLLAVGQALSRHHAAGAADQDLEAALGLTRAERVLARMGPALLGAAITAALAAAGALLGGLVEPLGAARFRARAGLAGRRAGGGSERCRCGVGVPAALGGDRSPGRAHREPQSGAGLASAARAASPRPGRAGRGRVVLRAARLPRALRRTGSRDRPGRRRRDRRRGGRRVVRRQPGPAHRDPRAVRLGRRLLIVDAKADDAAALAADPRVAAVAVIDATNVNVDGRRTWAPRCARQSATCH